MRKIIAKMFVGAALGLLAAGPALWATPAGQPTAASRPASNDPIAEDHRLSIDSADGDAALIAAANDPAVAARIEVISLGWDTRVSDDGLVSLRRFPRLWSIIFKSGEVDDQQLGALVSLKLHNLREVLLSNAKVTDAGVRQLRDAKGIENVALRRCRGVTDGAIETLLAMPLHLLDVRDTTISDAGFVTLHNALLKRGEEASVSLGNAGSTAAGLAPLRGSKIMNCVDLSGAEVDARMLDLLASWPNLDMVEMKGARLAPGALEKWQPPAGIYLLDLSGTGVTDGDVQFLGQLHKLEYLSFHEAPITDRTLALLTGCPGLRLLGARGCDVSSAGVKPLEALKNLSILSLNHTRVGGDAIVRLAEHCPLKVLGCPPGLTEEQIAAIKRLRPGIVLEGDVAPK